MRLTIRVKRKGGKFEQLLDHKKNDKGLTGDDALSDIIRSSTTTNKEYDKKAGVDTDGN